MKTLLFVRALKTEEDVERLREALQETRIDFEISLANQCVIVFGRNDIVYTAKTAIREAGYQVD